MDIMCSICFQPGELFQVPGYTLPTCIKCSEQLANKGISFYQTITNQNHQMQPASNPLLPAVATMPQTSSAQQQQQQQQAAHQAATTNGSTAASSQNTNAQQPVKKSDINIFELEQSLMNMESEYLFGDDGSCPMCSKTFTRRASLLNHIRNHSAERKYVCNYCQKGFTQAANLRNHERIHTNDRPYVCIDCGKAFTQITNLNNHRRLHTGERPFVCIEPDCGRSFAQVTNLNNHMKTHHKIQQYVCNQCPRKFTTVTQLNLHLTSHTGIREFFCPQCPNKSFKQQSHLLQHMKIHGADFGFPCTKCDEKFLQAHHLENHMKMHDTFKYKCEMCPSSFNQEVLLKKHIQRHIDGRYLTCPIAGCNDGFTAKHQLTKHIQMQHASESNLPKRLSVKRPSGTTTGKNNCYFESCDESFGDAESLNEHLRTTHGLSILKNVGKKTKMDIMLLDQLKNARENNVVDAAALGQSFNLLMANGGAPFLNNADGHLDANAMLQQQKRILSVAEIIDLSEQAKKSAEAKTGGGTAAGSSSSSFSCLMCAITFTTEEELRQHNFYKHPDKKSTALNLGLIGGGLQIPGMQVGGGGGSGTGGSAATAAVGDKEKNGHSQLLHLQQQQQQHMMQLTSQQQQHLQLQQHHLQQQQQQHHQAQMVATAAQHNNITQSAWKDILLKLCNQNNQYT